MKRLWAVLMVGLLGLTAAGCGGVEDQAAPDEAAVMSAEQKKMMEAYGGSQVNRANEEAAVSSGGK